MIIVDTGPLVALADADDADHGVCVRWFEQTRGRLVIPAPLVAEVCYLLGSRCGSKVEASFLDALALADPFEVIAPASEDYARAAELVRIYGNLPLGGSDACVIAIAERLGVATVATLDNRHFSIVRPRHITAFTLVP